VAQAWTCYVTNTHKPFYNCANTTKTGPNALSSYKNTPIGTNTTKPLPEAPQSTNNAYKRDGQRAKTTNMPTKPTKSTTKFYQPQTKPFEIRGQGKDSHTFRANVYDFLCEVYDKDIHSDFGRKLFAKLEQKFAADGGLRALCKYKDIDGEMIPTMLLRQLKSLMFRLDNKDVKKARITLFNISYARVIIPVTKEIIHDTPIPARVINPLTKEIIYDTPIPKKVLPPTKDQPVYYKLQLIPDHDPIRGVMHTDKDGVTDIHWGVFDFLCVMYEHNTTDAFGRKKFEQINKARDGELDTLVTRLKTHKAAKDTPTLTADQLIDLSMMYVHPNLNMGRDACKFFERVAVDYTQCAEVTVDADA